MWELSFAESSHTLIQRTLNKCNVIYVADKRTSFDKEKEEGYENGSLFPFSYPSLFLLRPCKAYTSNASEPG